MRVVVVGLGTVTGSALYVRAYMKAGYEVVLTPAQARRIARKQ